MKKKSGKMALISIAVTMAMIAAVAIGTASAQSNSRSSMMSMMGGMGNMMSGMSGMHNDGFVHSKEDIEWMKERMNLTDEEFADMAAHCPMMGERINKINPMASMIGLPPFSRFLERPPKRCIRHITSPKIIIVPKSALTTVIKHTS